MRNSLFDILVGHWKSQISWLKEKYPNEYKEGEWHFDFDKAITEINVGNRMYDEYIKNRTFSDINEGGAKI